MSGGCSIEEKPSEYGAQVACEDFVKDRLKSPGTADFSDTEREGSGRTWTVRGSVDSQNSFGAVVRNTYTCKVHATDTKGETWKLDDLQTSGN